MILVSCLLILVLDYFDFSNALLGCLIQIFVGNLVTHFLCFCLAIVFACDFRSLYEHTVNGGFWMGRRLY